MRLYISNTCRLLNGRQETFSAYGMHNGEAEAIVSVMQWAEGKCPSSAGWVTFGTPKALMVDDDTVRRAYAALAPEPRP